MGISHPTPLPRGALWPLGHRYLPKIVRIRSDSADASRGPRFVHPSRVLWFPAPQLDHMGDMPVPSPTPETKPFVVRLPSELHQAISELAESSERSMAQEIRFALKRHLAAQPAA